MIAKIKWNFLRSRRYLPIYAAIMTFLLAIICEAVSGVEDFATIWLGNAMLLILIFRNRRSQAYGIFWMGMLGNVLGTYATGAPFLYALAFGAANVVELAPAMIFIRMRASGDIMIDEFNKHLLDIAIYITLGCILSAILGGMILSKYTNYPLEPLILSWFSADIIAMLAIMPVGLSFTIERFKSLMRLNKFAEFMFITIGSVVVSLVSWLYLGRPFVIIMIPLLYAAFRLEILGATIVGLVNVVVLLIMVHYSFFYAQFNELSLINNAYFLMSVTLLPPLIIAILVNQRNIFSIRVKESEERFRGAMEHSAIGMAIVGLDGKWLEINKALCHIVGYPEHELIRLTFNDITYPPDLAKNLMLLAELNEGRRNSYRLEKRYIRKDGKLVWVLLVVSAATDAAGKPIYYIAQIEDINEKKQIEKELRDSEERWKYALAGGSQGVWDWDFKNDDLYFSPTWKSMLGYRDDEIKHELNEWRTRVHPDDLEPTLALIDQHLKGVTDEYVSEHRLKTKDGKYKWILDRGRVISRNEKGEPIRMIGTHTDIDAIKQTESELQHLSQRLSLAITIGKIGIFELDLLTDTLVWDERMHELYGIEPDKFTHNFEAWSNSVHPDDYDLVYTAFQQALTDEVPFDTEFRIITPIGDIRHIRANAMVIRDVHGRPAKVLGTNWDITYERQLSYDFFREKEKLRVTLASIGDGVVVSNAFGQIDFINPRASRLMGCSPEYAAGKKFEDICQFISEATGSHLEAPIAVSIKDQVIFYQDEDVVLRNNNGERFYLQCSSAPIRSVSGVVIGAVMVMHDVTINRNLKMELKHFASHDPLTGLMNRREFENVLKRYSGESRGKHVTHSLFYVDLDRFKIVNDSAGHAAGDELLRQLCVHLKAAIRSVDVLARIGGDEFAILLPECDKHNAKLVADKIISSLKSYHFMWENMIYDIGVSIGVTVFTSHTISADVLMRHADIACYHAKNNGGNAFSIYDEEDNEHQSQHAEIKMLAAIKESIDKKRFILFAHEIRPIVENGVYQPYYEILLRWIDGDGNIMQPSQFIAVAERHNQMAAIDDWVARKVLMEYGPRIAAIKHLSLSINLSAKSINAQSFLTALQTMVRTTTIPTTRIGFELTETAAINHLANAGEFFQFIENEGCFIALDDFGVGLSSFNYLKHFPVKFVKIDGSFIKRLVDSTIDKAIVESINELVHRLGGCTIAEYVESEEIMNVVKAIGIDYVQGHYIGEARPLEDLLTELEANQSA